MRQASLYYYFESKEAALEAVCVSGLEDYAKRALAISKSDVTSSEKVAALVFQHLAPLAERLDYTVVFLRERRFLPQPARKRIRAIEVRYERLIERIIEQGSRAASSAGPRRPHGGLALLGLGNSAALWFAREPGTTVERVARSYIDLLVRGFRVR